LPELKQTLASLAAADGLLAVSNVTAAADSSKAGPTIMIPGYKILHRVGQGGQAVVYAAIKENTGRKVAVKVLLHGAFVGPQGRARFDREVSILAKLHHPNIVTVIDRGVTPDGSLFIVMDFIEGMSLDKHIAEMTPVVDPTVDTQGPPDRGLMLVLFSKICDAIQVAHEQGVIHRDLKPSNILIDERGEPHILDFGVARSALPDENQRNVSITDQFLGTLAWASPEQADSRPLDHRTDIYSLGLVLYYMLTSGKFPYNVLGPMARVLNNILQSQPIPPSMALAPNPARSERAGKREYLPPEPPLNAIIEAIVLKALSKKPEDRYSSAKEMAEAIRKYLSGMAETSRTAARPRRGVPWVRIGVAAVLVVFSI
jgi:serine/threonine-protein kinase